MFITTYPKKIKKPIKCNKPTSVNHRHMLPAGEGISKLSRLKQSRAVLQEEKKSEKKEKKRKNIYRANDFRSWSTKQRNRKGNKG